MGQILIEGMEFYAFHGHFEEEKVVGGKFLVDIDIKTDLELPGHTDKLEDALDYQAVYLLVKQEMGKKSSLLENLALRIIERLFTYFETIQEVKVKVSKVNPPLGGKVEKVSVEMARHRDFTPIRFSRNPRQEDR